MKRYAAILLPLLAMLFVLPTFAQEETPEATAEVAESVELECNEDSLIVGFDEEEQRPTFAPRRRAETESFVEVLEYALAQDSVAANNYWHWTERGDGWFFFVFAASQQEVGVYDANYYYSIDIGAGGYAGFVSEISVMYGGEVCGFLTIIGMTEGTEYALREIDDWRTNLPFTEIRWDS
jgi:hypothetical protein